MKCSIKLDYIAVFHAIFHRQIHHQYFFLLEVVEGREQLRRKQINSWMEFNDRIGLVSGLG